MKYLSLILAALLPLTLSAQTKLSDLIEGTTIVATDLIPFVDVSDTTMAASGSTKKATAQTLINELAQLIAPTWNNGATDFTALKVNVTNTASANTSRFIDVLNNGTRLFYVSKNQGNAPYGVELYMWSNGGGSTLRSDGNGFYIAPSCDVAVGDSLYTNRSGVGGGIKIDNAVKLYGQDQNILAQRNGTNAQTFRVYNTYTSATSNEFINIGWTTSVAQIGTVKGSGGGSARDLVLQTDGVTRMTFGAAGTATVNTAFVADSTALINAGSQAFNSSFHLVSWNNGCFGWASTGTVTAASSLDTALKRVSAGLVEINTGTAGVYGSLVLKDLRMSTPTVPATSTSTGSEGQISWDANYIYVCTATNTWKRAALATW